MHNPNLKSVGFLFLISLMLGACESTSNEETVKVIPTWDLLVGTYTQKESHVDGKGEGIYVLEVNQKSGNLSQVGQSPPLINPSYLTLHPKQPVVYAVNEHGADESAQISALSFNADTKEMSLINEVSSKGHYPCHIEVDPTGSAVFVSNYGSGSIAAYEIASNGTIGNAGSFIEFKDKGPHPNQEASHAHMVLSIPNQRSVLVLDLGGDKIYRYSVDPVIATLSESGVTSSSSFGAGPRHLDFHPEMSRAYVMNELNGTIDVYNTFGSSDEMPLVQSISIVTNAGGVISGADIHVHPNGKYLYASNRGSYNEIVHFRIYPGDGKLTFQSKVPSGGQTPRNFVISPDGRFLYAANQDSNSIQCFLINDQNGSLTKHGEPFEVPSPVCLKFVDNYN